MKIHRILLYCFLFAFIGQLGVTYNMSKKSSIEWSDADDDSCDSEDFEEEVMMGYSPIILALSIHHLSSKALTHSTWRPLSFTQSDLLFSIDYPPEIS